MVGSGTWSAKKNLAPATRSRAAVPDAARCCCSWLLAGVGLPLRVDGVVLAGTVRAAAVPPHAVRVAARPTAARASGACENADGGIAARPCVLWFMLLPHCPRSGRPLERLLDPRLSARLTADSNVVLPGVFLAGEPKLRLGSRAMWVAVWACWGGVDDRF